MWDISRIGQYGILLLGISSEASRRRGMEKVNSFREPVGAAGFCAIWQRNGEAGIRKKQHNCKLKEEYMKITKQDGTVVRGHNIEMQGCRIFCTPDGIPLKNRVLCGEYSDMLRTTEVFSEMTYMGWNIKNPEYTMPQN